MPLQSGARYTTEQVAVDGEDQVAYECHEWSHESRVMFESLLQTAGVSHAWHGITVMVRETDEERVDAMAEEVEASTVPQLDPELDKVGYETNDWSDEHQTDVLIALTQAGIPHLIDAEGDLVVLVQARLELLDGGHAAIETSYTELHQFMDWAGAEPRTVAESEAFLRQAETEWDGGIAFNYAMTDPETSEVIGVCGLMTRPGPGRLEIGYWVRSDRAGAGIATEAARLLTDAALAVTDIDIAEIHHDAANGASGRIPEKLGYTEAERREVEIDNPGECGIEVIWEVTRADWALIR